MIRLAGFSRAAEDPQGVAEVMVHDRQLGAEADGFLEMGQGFGGPASLQQGEPQIRPRHRGIGLEFDGAPEVGDRILEDPEFL